MRISGFSLGLLLITGVLGADPALANQPSSQVPSEHGTDTKFQQGVIGIALQIGAEHVGDPAVLYVGMVHPQGPAHQAGLRQFKLSIKSVVNSFMLQ